MKFLFDNGNQHVGRDGAPDLRLHRILAVTDETLDAQMLLDPLEEQLHLPPALVKRGNGQRGQRRIVGQKHQRLAGFRVFEAGEMGATVDTAARQYALGWAHDLSKSTDIYALYTVVDNDAAATYGLWSGSQPIAGFANESVSSLSVGLNHRFSSR